MIVKVEDSGLWEEFYIQELTPNVVANAVSTVTRICRIFFQIGLIITSKQIKSPISKQITLPSLLVIGIVSEPIWTKSKY